MCFLLRQSWVNKIDFLFYYRIHQQWWCDVFMDSPKNPSICVELQNLNPHPDDNYRDSGLNFLSALLYEFLEPPFSVAELCNVDFLLAAGKISPKKSQPSIRFRCRQFEVILLSYCLHFLFQNVGMFPILFA